MSTKASLAGILLCALAATALADLTGSAAPVGQQGTLSAGPEGAAAGAVLMQGAGGAVTDDAVAAYFEALEFVHDQLGQPAQFDAAARQQFVQTLAAHFGALPLETQQTLAQARVLWTSYQQSWDALPLADKQEFAYFVLALAYGEQQAAQALGVQGTAGGGTGGSYGGLDVDAPYEGSDCWGSAGCSYDSGSGTYTYDTYE